MNAAKKAGAPPGRLQHVAIRLKWFSVDWMLFEGGVAVAAGVIAGSPTLTSFGFDSVIELISATLVLRRMRAEKADASADEKAERRVLRRGSLP